MLELRWLHDHGLIGTYADYFRLPVYVLSDARIAMEIEGEAKAAAARQEQAAVAFMKGGR